MNTMRTGLLMAALMGLFLAVGYLLGREQGMFIAFLMAAGMNVFAYWNADKMVLRMHGARQVDRQTAPEFYQLIEDLSQRGLLVSTLVVLCSEFGRGPKINGNAGRDHHPRVFSTLLAGGGVKTGYVHGSSDKEGNSVADKQVSPQDFLSTIGWSLGLPVDEVVMSPSNRPFTVGDKGKPVMEVFA